MTCPICGNAEKSNICSFCGYDRSCDCELYPLLSRRGKAVSAKSAFRLKFYSDIIKKSDGLEARVAELEHSMKYVLEKLSSGTASETSADALQSSGSAKLDRLGGILRKSDPKPAEISVSENAENPTIDTNVKPLVSYDSMKPGDTVSLGHYKNAPLQWCVLSSDEKGTLLLSKYIIDLMSFLNCNDNNEGDSAQSVDLPGWLEGTFFYDSFSEKEQSMIVPCKTDTEGLTVPCGSVTGEGASKVFLLSTGDYRHYRNVFGIQTFMCTPDAFQKCEENKVATPDTWWLRSKGGINGTASCVDKNGYISYVLNLSGYLRGVRPAIFVAADRENCSGSEL